MSVRLRPATEADEAFLANLYCDVHAAEFAPLQLPAAALAQLLQMQCRAQQMSYRAQFPHAEDSILMLAETPIGRMLVAREAGSIRIVDIALLAAFRGQGFGGLCLSKICAEARAAGLSVDLSVRAGNPAANLYRRLGFVETGSNGIDIAMQLSVPHR